MCHLINNALKRFKANEAIDFATDFTRCLKSNEVQPGWREIIGKGAKMRKSNGARWFTTGNLLIQIRDHIDELHVLLQQVADRKRSQMGATVLRLLEILGNRHSRQELMKQIWNMTVYAEPWMEIGLSLESNDDHLPTLLKTLKEIKKNTTENKLRPIVTRAGVEFDPSVAEDVREVIN